MADESTDRRRGRLAKAFGLVVAGLTAWRTARGREHPDPESLQESHGPDGADGPQSGVDPSERTVPANRRAENAVALLLVCAGLLGFAFTVIYIVLEYDTQLLGVAMGGCLAMLAAAAIVAGKLVVPQETHVEDRGLLLDEEQTEEVVEMVEAGGEGISRRGLLVGCSGLAGAGLITAVATPLASLGPASRVLRESPWTRGVRLVDEQSQPFPADEIQIGTFYTALPEGQSWESMGSGLLVVRLPANMIHLPAARRDWAPDGILAYSKICPHAACAISLYRYPTYQSTSVAQPAFTCPCHYSTFEPGFGGRVIFGPAGRPLPQLPL